MEAATCGVEEALKRRTREPTMGGRAIVWTRRGVAIQDHGLALCASYGPGGIVEGADSVGCEGRLSGGRVRATRAGCHIRGRHRGTVSSEVIYRQG